MSDVTLSKAVRTNLLSLQNTATLMEKTQQRLATGNKVNSALDNPSNFFTASALNSRAADMSNLLDSMASGIKVIEAANNGLTALTKNLESMQSTLRQARQDKSFQTRSFDVTDSSVLRVEGGRFVEDASTISLATATTPGVKAALTTSSADPYLGPVSNATQGAGARSVISPAGGIGAGDKFTVAGVEVTVGTITDPTEITEEIAADIRAALTTNTDTNGKYTVSTDDNKIIIETVDTTGAAAIVSFENAVSATAVTQGVKARTTFNYSALTPTVTAGGQSIATGTSYDEFIANLQSKATEGNYTVDHDPTTGQITLIATQHGQSAPSVSGVAAYAAEVVGQTAKSVFTLANGSSALTDTQTLTIGGTATAALTSGMSAQVVQDTINTAINADSSLNGKFTAVVTSGFQVTLEEVGRNGLAAPTVTTSKLAAIAQRSSHTAAGGLNFVNGSADATLQTLSGAKITLSGTGITSPEYTIGNTSNVADLTATLSSNGFLVNATADGFNVSRSDGKDFAIVISGGGSNSLGFGSTTVNVNNGVVAQTAGITGTVAAKLEGTGGTLATDGNLTALAGTVINIKAAGFTPVSYTVSGTSTRSQLEATLSQHGFSVVAGATGLSITRADGVNFTLAGC